MDWLFNDRKLPTAEQIAKKIEKGKPIEPKKLFNLSDACPQIDGSMKAIKELVTYFKKTHLNAKLAHTLKQEVVTRWNSELIMLESYGESANEVQKLLLQTDSIKKLVDINDNLVRELIEFLVPFRDCSQILSGDTYPTIQQVALWYHDLRDHITVKDTDSAEMRKLKEQAAHCYEEYLVVDDLHYVACILDPRYKSLQFADTNSKTRAFTLLQEYIDEQEVAMSRHPMAASIPKNVETSHRKSRFTKYMDDTNSQVVTELNRYLLHNFPGVNDGENVEYLV